MSLKIRGAKFSQWQAERRISPIPEWQLRIMLWCDIAIGNEERANVIRQYLNHDASDWVPKKDKPRKHRHR